MFAAARHIAIYLLVAVSVWAPLRQLAGLAVFTAWQQQIAERQCVNRFSWNQNCNGRCQLKRMMAQESPRQHSKPLTYILVQEQPALPLQAVRVEPACAAWQNRGVSPYHHLTAQHQPGQLLHPPAVA